nr:hypothetical protein [Tanacetum cinerariifolium]
SISCSPECNIVGKILLDHLLSYALTATADVPAIHEQTKINIFQLFHAVVNRINVDYAALLWIDEDYHSIKDYIPLVSVYTTRNVLVRGMVILDEFLTEEIHATDDYKEYEMVFFNVAVAINQPQPVVSTQATHRSTPKAYKTPTLTSASSQRKKMKQRVDEKEGNEMGSLEIRTKKMQTLIPTTPRSPRINLSSDKNIVQELMDIVSFFTPTTSKAPYKQRRISSKYSHLPDALRRICRRQGYMINNMERKADDAFHSQHHDDHQDDDAPPEGEKRGKRQKTLRVKSLQGVLRRNNQVDEHLDDDNAPLNNATSIGEDNHNKSDTQDSKYDADSSKNEKAKDDVDVMIDKENEIHEVEMDMRSILMTFMLTLVVKVTIQVEGEVHLISSKMIFMQGEVTKQQQEWDARVEETIIDEDEVILEDETQRANHRISKYEKMGIFCEWKTNSTDDEAFVIINP